MDSLNMSVEQGSLVGLIGPNGAGKTTAFNLLTGVYQPTDGSITLDGMNLVGKRPAEICRQAWPAHFRISGFFPR